MNHHLGPSVISEFWNHRSHVLLVWYMILGSEYRRSTVNQFFFVPSVGFCLFENLKAPVLECLKPFFQSDEYSKASGSFLQFDEYVRIVHSTILEIWRFLEDPSWVYLCNVLEYSVSSLWVWSSSLSSWFGWFNLYHVVKNISNMDPISSIIFS